MLFPVAPQPGVFRQATEYQDGGQFSALGSTPPRWWDASLTRFYGDQLGPVGGFRPRSSHAVTGRARTILPWITNTGARWLGVGTHSGLFVQDASGVVSDITPVGFIAGQEDETANVGFGVGPFGAGAFGTARPDTGLVTEALVWDLDTWADKLVGCAFSDGRIVQWDLNAAHKATAITNAPIGCLGAFVAEQGFLFAVAPGGARRTLQWSDQGDNTLWTPSTTNQAGQIDLVSPGSIKEGRRFGSIVFVLTDMDAHVGEYVGLPSVWSFARVGTGCGAVSRGCIIEAGQQLVWWGHSGFWLYNGQVQAVPCDVWDFLKQNVNLNQRSKISGFHNSQFGECWWFYPSAGATENDAYVYWDYRRNHWNIGLLARLCAAEVDIFKYPLALGADGLVYEHEVGDGYGGAIPFAETGPIELGGGDQAMNCFGVIADERIAGQVTLDFRLKPYPNGSETILAETTLTSAGRADLRFSARQAKMRITGAAAADWRFGKARLELRPGGRR